MTSVPNPPILNDETVALIREALLETYYKGSWVIGNESELAHREIFDHTRGRFDVCRRWLVPWIQRYVDLDRLHVVEIGCGTGSSTAAIALSAAQVSAYDIAGISVQAARRRIHIMGLNNVQFYEEVPSSLLECISRNHARDTVDCVMLYAVLEHQKYQERIDTLRLCWSVLKPGGILVVGDTPNRLTWLDEHTSGLPFFNALPDEVALDYSPRSSRVDFRTAIATARARSNVDAFDMLARWGRGVSYHEFELALGDLEGLIIADGFDPEPLNYFGVSLETRLLFTYARRKNLAIPVAFLRSTIEIILRKPSDVAEKAQDGTVRDLDAIVRPLVDPA
jgi:SAM-dependent methyltransferase